MEGNPDAPVLRTTDTSLSILALVEDREGATLPELVDATGNAKSSVYAHLRTLRRHDLLTKEGETYHVGLRTLGYAEQARSRKPEYELAGRAVDDLVGRADAQVRALAAHIDDEALPEELRGVESEPEPAGTDDADGDEDGGDGGDEDEEQAEDRDAEADAADDDDGDDDAAGGDALGDMFG